MVIKLSDSVSFIRRCVVLMVAIVRFITADILIRAHMNAEWLSGPHGGWGPANEAECGASHGDKTSAVND